MSMTIPESKFHPRPFPCRRTRRRMPHHVPLIATMVAAIVLAFVFGALAHRLRLSPLVGYLLAGVAIGPRRDR